MQRQSALEPVRCQVRIGVDLVCVERFAQLLRDHPGAAHELFTTFELAYCDGKRRRVEHLAARFAAKEAVLKAFGTGLAQRTRWTDVEVRNNSRGRPLVRLGGAVAARASARGVRDVDVSLTHTASLAMAHAVVITGSCADVAWLGDRAGPMARDFDALSPD